MTNPPDDLVSLRHGLMIKTGITDPVDIGIVGDDAHENGYHIGTATLKRRGIYPDYSTRLAQDKVDSDDASGMDVSLAWSSAKGGRSAAIAWSNNLANAVKAGQLPEIAEINWMRPDGAKRRYVAATKLETTSSDTVDIHTHIGWYRNTIGKRDKSFNFMLGGTPVAEFTQQQINDIAYTLGVTSPGPGPIHARVSVILSKLDQLLGVTPDYHAMALAFADVLVQDQTLQHITDADRDSIANAVVSVFTEHLAQ